jgi:hypothetical protein
VRCGFACANALGAKPEAAMPAAATPLTNRRRFMAVAASGSMQQLQGGRKAAAFPPEHDGLLRLSSGE